MNGTCTKTWQNFKLFYQGIRVTCQGFPGSFGQIHENSSPRNFSYARLSAKKFTKPFIKVVIWRSFRIKNNYFALRYFELKITTS